MTLKVIMLRRRGFTSRCEAGVVPSEPESFLKEPGKPVPFDLSPFDPFPSPPAPFRPYAFEPLPFEPLPFELFSFWAALADAILEKEARMMAGGRPASADWG